MIRRVQNKFEAWRQEPAEVRLRIATLLTAGTGVVAALLWLFVLLPLQLHLSAPGEPGQAAKQLRGVVSGIRDIATPTPTPSLSPTPMNEVQYYNDTRPSYQGQ